MAASLAEHQQCRFIRVLQSTNSILDSLCGGCAELLLLVGKPLLQDNSRLVAAEGRCHAYIVAA